MELLRSVVDVRREREVKLHQDGKCGQLEPSDHAKKSIECLLEVPTQNLMWRTIS